MAARSYLVIGGGIVGAASALRLRAAGFEVTLIDPGDPRRGASFGNIGHIAAEQVMPLASPRTLMTFPRRLFSLGGPLAFRDGDMRAWAPWALKFARASTPFRYTQGVMALDSLQRESMAAWQRIFALANTPSLVKPCGHFVVWMSDATAKRAHKAWKKASIGPTKFRDMNTEELARVGSGMKTPPAAGIAFTGTGQVSEPQAVRDALLQAFALQGGITVSDTVSAVSAKGDSVTTLLDSGRALNAEAAVIAAGAWSRPLMKGLGIDVPLIAERGYSMQSAEHKWPDDVPPVVFEERALVVTRFTSGLRCSSFVEFGRPDSPPDSRKWDRLVQHLNALGIHFSPTPVCWCGPRPTLPDYLPAIGRMEQYPRVLYAFGHQHLGMTLASVTAELIESLALWEMPRINLAPFRVERFA